jgi:hypothetical protein
VAGNWTASILAAGVHAGGDQLFATPDDAATAGGNRPELFSRIASITIGGKVSGTAGSGDHFGFVAQEIGSLSVAGKESPLKSGRSNDNIGLVSAKFQLGSTGGRHCPGASLIILPRDSFPGSVCSAEQAAEHRCSRSGLSLTSAYSKNLVST